MGIAIAAFSAAFVADKKGGFGTRQRAGATWRTLNKFVEAKRWKGETLDACIDRLLEQVL
jgi:hypothetical protein